MLMIPTSFPSVDDKLLSFHLMNIIDKLASSCLIGNQLTGLPKVGWTAEKFFADVAREILIFIRGFSYIFRKPFFFSGFVILRINQIEDLFAETFVYFSSIFRSQFFTKFCNLANQSKLRFICREIRFLLNTLSMILQKYLSAKMLDNAIFPGTKIRYSPANWRKTLSMMLLLQ